MEQIHNQLIEALKKIKGIDDVNYLFENPNKYGDVMSYFYFKHHIEDKWNFSRGEFSFDYKLKQLFIPNKGYQILDNVDVTNIVKIVKEHYKLK